MLAFEWLDVSYEYLINEESSFGIAGLIAINGSEVLNYYRKSSLLLFTEDIFQTIMQEVFL